MNIDKFDIHQAVLGITDIRHLIAIMFNTTNLFEIKEVLRRAGYPFGSTESFVNNLQRVHESWIKNNKDFDKITIDCIGCVDPFDKLEEANSFEFLLWDKFCKLSDNDLAYVTLYDELRNESNKQNYKNCNNFLFYVMDKKLNTNFVVHVINVLNPYKENLSNFNNFAKKTKEVISENETKENAKLLIKILFDE